MALRQPCRARQTDVPARHHDSTLPCEPVIRDTAPGCRRRTRRLQGRRADMCLYQPFRGRCTTLSGRLQSARSAMQMKMTLTTDFISTTKGQQKGTRVMPAELTLPIRGEFSCHKTSLSLSFLFWPFFSLFATSARRLRPRPATAAALRLPPPAPRAARRPASLSATATTRSRQGDGSHAPQPCPVFRDFPAD